MEQLHLSTADLMILGSVVLSGVCVFLLARILYPEKLIEEMRTKTAAERESREQAQKRGEVSEAGPGAIKVFGGALLQKLGNYDERLVKPEWRSRMQARFTSMGRPEFRPQDFIAFQQMCTVGFGILALLVLNVMHRPLPYAIVGGVFGYVFPYIWLRDQIQRRQYAIARALPYHIDLLTLSVEAGLDFQAALGTVVEKGRGGALLEEFNLMLNEMRLGKTRAEALRNMADRIQLTEMSAFVGNLIQADRMGTSLGKVLRIQSTQMRISRTHRAEKLANEAPVKMLLPLIACIFPTVFLILFGPIVYRLMVGG
jgi:tight adherence protein C